MKPRRTLKGVSNTYPKERQAIRKPEFKADVKLEPNVPVKEVEKRHKMKRTKSLKEHIQSKYIGVYGHRYYTVGKARTPIKWYAKRNNKMEMCDSEIAAAIRADEMVKEMGIKSKLARLNFPNGAPTISVYKSYYD